MNKIFISVIDIASLIGEHRYMSKEKTVNKYKKQLERGILQEDTAIQWFKDSFKGDVKRLQESKELIINSDITLCARIDAMYTDTKGEEFILEVKIRHNHLFDMIPIYERIQIQMYMHIWKVNNAILCQKYKDNYKISYLSYDKEFIISILDKVKKTINDEVVVLRKKNTKT